MRDWSSDVWSSDLDPQNCGECGASCGDNNGSTCVSCNCVCAQGLTYCGQNSGCVNLSTDKDHCGSCQNNCDGGQQCVNGNCQG